MGLNIKNTEVERLASEISAATGETKTEAIRQALLMRRDRLALPSAERRWENLKAWLETDVWPLVPEEIRRRGLTKEEFDEAVGYGPEGY
jgi:antitoxin VapB